MERLYVTAMRIVPMQCALSQLADVPTDPVSIARRVRESR